MKRIFKQNKRVFKFYTTNSQITNNPIPTDNFTDTNVQNDFLFPKVKLFKSLFPKRPSTISFLTGRNLKANI